MSWCVLAAQPLLTLAAAFTFDFAGQTYKASWNMTMGTCQGTKYLKYPNIFSSFSILLPNLKIRNFDFFCFTSTVSKVVKFRVGYFPEIFHSWEREYRKNYGSIPVFPGISFLSKKFHSREWPGMIIFGKFPTNPSEVGLYDSAKIMQQNRRRGKGFWILYKEQQ